MKFIVTCVMFLVAATVVNADCPDPKYIVRKMQRVHDKFSAYMNNIDLTMSQTKLKKQVMKRVMDYYSPKIQIIDNGAAVQNGLQEAAAFWLTRKGANSQNKMTFEVQEAFSFNDAFAYAIVYARFEGRALSSWNTFKTFCKASGCVYQTSRGSLYNFSQTSKMLSKRNQMVIGTSP